MRPKTLRLVPKSLISQSALGRLLELGDALEVLLQVYERHRDELAREIRNGAMVEPGPIWDELRKRKVLHEKDSSRSA